jgi:hypothetical protein
MPEWRSGSLLAPLPLPDDPFGLDNSAIRLRDMTNSAASSQRIAPVTISDWRKPPSCQPITR